MYANFLINKSITLHDLALLCRQSYLGGSEWVDLKDLRFGIFEHHDQTIVVFRGSSNKANWLRDFDIIPKMMNSGQIVHRGFLNASQEIINHITANLDPNLPVVVTGHSMGGGIAEVVCELLVNHDTKYNCIPVTFGKPRTLFLVSKNYTIDGLRIVCDDDPVPKVPRIFYRQQSRALTLEDQDHEFLNPKDHDIEVYLKRLAG